MTNLEERTGPGADGGPSSALPLVLLVLVGSALVASAAHGLRLVLPALEIDGGGTWGIRVAGAVIAVGGVAALLAQRKRLAPDSAAGPDPTRVALTTAGTIMGLLTLVALYVHPLDPRDPVAPQPTLASQGPAPPPPADAERAPPPPNWVGGLGLATASEDRRQEAEPVEATEDQGIDPDLRERLARSARVVLVALAVVVGLWIVARRLARRWRKRTPEPPVPPADAEAGLEASLDAFADSIGDPRRQITAAYRRLLGALAAADAPREPQEAPHEHLERALGPLGLDREPLHRLAELYVVAHFSERPVTERHREAAVDALEVSLVRLRALHGSSDAHEGAPVSTGARP